MLYLIDIIELPSVKSMPRNQYDIAMKPFEEKGIHDYCDCCERGIRNVFLVLDTETNKTMCLGSECVKKYTTDKNKTINIDKLDDKKSKKARTKLNRIKIEIDGDDIPF